MSINHFLDKIKGKGAIDRKTVMFLCMLLGLGMAAFGYVEQLSAPSSGPDSEIVFTQTPGTTALVAPDTQTASSYSPVSSAKNFVASKNGKLYYSATCSGANRILPKNQIWFQASDQAEKLGYTLAASCK